MSNGKDGSQNMSRRMALTSTALAFVAAAGTADQSKEPDAGPHVRFCQVTRASAQQKITQATAKYQDQPKEKQSCAVCVHFEPPNACKFVQGTISPSGWCMLFAPKT
jgi:hypothetical protein